MSIILLESGDDSGSGGGGMSTWLEPGDDAGSGGGGMSTCLESGAGEGAEGAGTEGCDGGGEGAGIEGCGGGEGAGTEGCGGGEGAGTEGIGGGGVFPVSWDSGGKANGGGTKLFGLGLNRWCLLDVRYSAFSFVSSPPGCVVWVNVNGGGLKVLVACDFCCDGGGAC